MGALFCYTAGMSIQFPDPPASTIVDAWDTQKGTFVSDYEVADDGSGSIASVGSPPVPRYVQTYDEALEVLA